MTKLAALLLMLALTGVAHADDSDPAGRVARLGLAQGQVSVEPAGLEDWAAADINRPLTRGDKLWADADSRAEISIGSAVLRLGSATAFSFLNLDQNGAQMQLTAGTLGVHVRSSRDTLEVDAPNVAIALLGPGDYRIEVNGAGDTTVVKVSGGTAEVTGGAQDFAVHPQQLAAFTGTTNVSEQLASLGTPDAFDTWGYERDRQAQAAQAWSYVAPDVVGAEDLDQNGTWQSTPNDGYVWAPNAVAVGWAPYRFGHWIWISPWGWTWVDDAAWGFAPFHYGRWATFGGRWCWIPGPRRERPVYAPALVAWVAGAPLGTSTALAAGGAAWFPLGPHEVYVPAYPASQTYIRNVNISNTPVSAADILAVYNHDVSALHYVNRNAPGALTAISQAAFSAAQSVSRNAVRLSANEIAVAPMSLTAPAITPRRESLLGAGASGPGIRRPPPALLNRVVLARTIPPPAAVPFALQQEAIRANGGRPLGRSEVTAMQILAPAVHVRMTASAHSESRSGISRAARPIPAAVSPVQPVKPGALPVRPPAQASAPVSAPAATPILRNDRPAGAVGRGESTDRARENRGAPQVAPRSPAPVEDLNRIPDRPAPAIRAAPALPVSPPPPPTSPPPKIEEAPAPKPAGHAAPAPAHPMERGSHE